MILSRARGIHGFRAALLSDNGAVFSGQSRNGWVLRESALESLGIVGKHSTPEPAGEEAFEPLIG